MPTPLYSDWLDEFQRLLVSSNNLDPFPANAFFSFAKQGLGWLENGAHVADLPNIASWWPELSDWHLGQQSEHTTFTQHWKEWADCEQAVQTRYSEALQSAMEDLANRLESIPRPLADVQAFYALWIECSESAYTKLLEDENFLRTNAERCNAGFRLIADAKSMLQPDTDEMQTMRGELSRLRARVRELEGSR